MDYIRIKASFFIYACAEWFLVPSLEAVKDTVRKVQWEIREMSLISHWPLIITVVRLWVRPNLVTFQVHIERSVQQLKYSKDFPKNWNSFHKGNAKLKVNFKCTWSVSKSYLPMRFWNKMLNTNFFWQDPVATSLLIENC